MPFFHLIPSLLALALLLAACTSETTDPSDQPKAQILVDAAIAAHGGDQYDYAVIAFDFRDKQYRARLQGGAYEYQRSFEEAGRQVRDVLDHGGFSRHVNGAPVALPDTLRDAYANSVNSVIYFGLLPHGLNDPAVKKRYLGQTQIKGQAYDAVEITFRQEGGGKDFQDIFRYYFHPETHFLDYLSYQYETNGGGIRFRAAYHSRTVGGIRIQDYLNYEADPAKQTLADLPAAFNADALKELSRIELTEVVVQPLPRPSSLLP
jgi:hypothetical protein